MSESATLSNEGEDKKPKAVETVGLLDARLKDERRTFAKNCLLAFALTTIFIWLGNAVYWGSYYRQPGNLRRVGVALIDLDSPAAQIAGVTPVAGPALLQAAEQDIEQHPNTHLKWQIIDTTSFDLSSGIGGAARGQDVVAWANRAVIEEDYFAVIIANANATIAPNQALTTIAGGGTSEYTGKGAYTFYFNEARQFNTVDLWVRPNCARIMNQAAVKGAAALLQELGQRISQASAAVNPSALASIASQPFGYSEFSVRPLDAFAGIASTTVGQIYLIIFTYFVSLFWNGARGPIESKVKLNTLIALRLLVPFVEYFFVSLSISLISVAFHVPFNRFYTRGGFVIFWMSNWLAQTALGYPMEIALTTLGPRFTAFFLVIWVILNVSSIFLDLADMASFYMYGYIMPAWNSTSIAKSVAFGTANHMVQNFVVLLAWIVVSGSILAGLVVRQRKKVARQEQQQKS